MAGAKKVTTVEERQRAQDKRIQHKFGITLADRDERIRQQDNKCKVCGGPLDAYGPPNIDHFHFYVQAIRHYDNFLRDNFGWEALAFDERRQVICIRRALTKAAAVADVKKATMPWSIRGLLCFKCNRGLGAIEKFFNAARCPDNLLPVIEYFRVRLQKSLDNVPVL